MNPSLDSHTRFAVLLTCFNRKEKTSRCLQILFEQGLPEGLEFQVFVCDDGSKDGTGEMLTTEFAEVTVVQGNGHLFWNGGTNLAWNAAKDSGKFDFFLWLNDDTYLRPNALIDLFHQYFSFQKPGIITAACSDPQTG